MTGGYTAGMARSKPRRLGRPPASLSSETRARIIGAAQRCFALHGYDKTTNKDIAEAAGLTTGALYHYFDSKQALFITVLREKQLQILDSFVDAAASKYGTLDKLCAVLDCAVQLHQKDEHLARFVSIAPIEIDRHEEFKAATAPDGRPITSSGGLADFFASLVEQGQASGEIDPAADAGAMVQMLLATTAGLAQFAGLVRDPTLHERAMDSFKALLLGSLTRPEARPRSRRFSAKRAG
jgi:AcrR family transcriptional regulator